MQNSVYNQFKTKAKIIWKLAIVNPIFIPQWGAEILNRMEAIQREEHRVGKYYTLSN